MNFFESLESTAFGAWVRESLYGYPIVLSAHSIGMAIVVGVVLILSIRVLGYARHLPVNAFDRLLTVAWIGFIMNAISGVLLFFGNASNLIVNLPFILKLVLILAGGVSVWALWRTVGSSGDGIQEDGTATSRAKTLAIATIVFWLGAIVAGRLIGYTISYY